MSVDYKAMVNEWYESGEVLPVYRIDYTGVQCAYGRYTALEQMFSNLADEMEADGRDHDAYLLRLWMKSSSGFTRPHTPYWVQFTTREWKEVVTWIRKYKPEWYDHLRYYGGWTHE